MKTERTLEIYSCDNPSCETYLRHDPEADGSLPVGYHGTVEMILDHNRADEQDWFACRKACVRGAVLAMAEESQPDTASDFEIKQAHRSQRVEGGLTKSVEDSVELGLSLDVSEDAVDESSMAEDL